jgi:hypothetical protein
MKTIDYYLFPEHDLDQVREALQNLLDVQFLEHDSLYWGRYFLNQSDIEFRILTNIDPLEDEAIFLEFPLRKTILEVKLESNSDKAIPNLEALEIPFRHLKRQEYE